LNSLAKKQIGFVNCFAAKLITTNKLMALCKRAARKSQRDAQACFQKIKIMFALRRSQRLISAVSSQRTQHAPLGAFIFTPCKQRRTRPCSKLAPAHCSPRERSQLYCNERKVDTDLCFSF
jgi:hypothetical protein